LHACKIPRFGGGRTIAKKIISLYYQEDVVPIFNTEHMKHIANGLDIDLESECMKKYGESYENTSCGKAFELFNELLLEIKRSCDVLKEWDNTFFMHFLYTTLRPPKRKVATRKDRVRKTELKILLAKFKEGKISEEEFVEIMSKKSLAPILLKLLKKIGIAWDELHDPYEQEVVSLFSKLHKELGFPYIKVVRDAFPDAIVVGKNNEQKRIEFKVFSSDFNYDPKGCDFIVCWEDDWGKEKPKNLPEIISLKTFILKNLL